VEKAASAGDNGPQPVGCRWTTSCTACGSPLCPQSVEISCPPIHNRMTCLDGFPVAAAVDTFWTTPQSPGCGRKKLTESVESSRNPAGNRTRGDLRTSTAPRQGRRPAAGTAAPFARGGPPGLCVRLGRGCGRIPAGWRLRGARAGRGALARQGHGGTGRPATPWRGMRPARDVEAEAVPGRGAVAGGGGRSGRCGEAVTGRGMRAVVECGWSRNAGGGWTRHASPGSEPRETPRAPRKEICDRSPGRPRAVLRAAAQPFLMRLVSSVTWL
jgi:hypothetical protein